MDNIPQIQNVYAFNADSNTLQKVSVTSSSAKTTNAVGAELILLIADTDCHIAFGASPAATTSSFLLPAMTYLAVACQATDKVAVIEDTEDGNLWVAALS